MSGLLDKIRSVRALYTLSLYIKKLSPPQTIAGSFLLVILLGALLLMLPVSQGEGMVVSAMDALFTATSAVCVTGLVTITTATAWSLFGKAIILTLIQIGGLSLITIYTFFVVYMGKKVTLKERLAVQAAFNTNDMSGMVRMVILVIRGTLLCEAVGALALLVFFLTQGLPFPTAFTYGVFHAVSAFCNAGFDIIGEQSLVPYAQHPALNLIIMLLIVLGGIGFTVWRDVLVKLRYLLTPRLKKKIRLSVHSRLAIITTLVLICMGAVYFFFAEYRNPDTLGALPAWQKAMTALFQSVTLRTAGYATFAQEGMRDASKMVSSALMLIGGSPGGTAGGIKTVTLAVILCSVWSTLRGRTRTTVFGRSIPAGYLQKALVVLFLMLGLLLAGTVLLSFTEKGIEASFSSADRLFEVASALGTVGLTTGMTPHLSAPGKVVIMLCMFIGRIGPLALLLSISARTTHTNDRIRYPDEDVMIG